MPARLGRGLLARVLPLFLAALFCMFLLHLHYAQTWRQNAWQITRPKFTPGVAKPASEEYTKTVVMARLKSEDISWVYNELQSFNHSIYTVDDDEAELRVPQNKGREAMAYLTYIIDHYDNLPDTVLFFHPHRSTRHNNVLLDLDSARTINRLNPGRVARHGYFNARCHHDPGCPNWLHVNRPEREWDMVKKKEEQYLTSEVWRQLHESDPIPEALSQPCCAQFAVSGERIRTRPLTDYLRYRQWLLDTDMADEFSGRMLEYNWQYIFTGEPEFCPPQHECYCDGYGICFGGTTDDNLQDWLHLLRQRELLDEQLRDLRREDPGTRDQHRIAAAESEKSELVLKLDMLKAEAYRRGEDPKNRALECGRPWKPGDGF
ncbi:hypothetical protein A1O7_09569 [Cladophialophora yegresii CBS 114405]|uniref:Uncharacterized protein n=1 Tax=Cladophialophora yegresii CBS 114405 TaxID=1182544 RepID=W9VF30_9EURO|nr:uncharacterized protein A1O7_09569 [Cladophialophora yegresii CBS 114405]EXJ54232.1 hypothetical protein A1O7_09569 [Cladophialophora yegresii CBS 114405]